MAIVTHTISVNPAFLREIKDDHHELRQLMHHTGAMFARPEWMPAEHRSLIELLGRLRDQLAMHFSLEEAYGYFEDALDTAPHLARRAEELRGQHGELYAELAILAEDAERLPNQRDGAGLILLLAERYRSFAADFAAHESLESQLILEAFNSDIGAGD